MAHEVPALPYDYSALEPYIDTQTMHLHHDKHHVAYVTNLNAALEKAPELQKLSAEELVKSLENVPEAIRAAVRNNAGGHVNHTMFWTIMGPNAGGEPSGAIADAIKNTFGDFNASRKSSTMPASNSSAAAGHGWCATVAASCWLCRRPIRIARSARISLPSWATTSGSTLIT